jgi:toxin YoeB
MMTKSWHDEAWDDYLYWQTQDKKTFKRINQLIKDIDSTPFSGIGKPEPLKHEYQGYWSRRIDEKNRLVYRIENNMIIIAQCRTLYDKLDTGSACHRYMPGKQRIAVQDVAVIPVLTYRKPDGHDKARPRNPLSQGRPRKTKMAPRLSPGPPTGTYQL